MFNRKLWALLALMGLFAPAIQAEVFHATYGVAKVFPFKLYNADGTLDVDEADGGTEVSLSCNQGAETTATNDFVDEGTHYSISLTAAELQCQTVAVVIAATTTEVFFIETIGHASAFITTTGWETGDAFARLGAPAGASVSADIAAVEAQTDDIGAAGAGLTVLATQASVNAVDDFLDTEMAAVLAAVDTEVAAILDDTGTTGVVIAEVTGNCREVLGCDTQGTLSGTHSTTTADLGTNAPANDISGMTLEIPTHNFSRVISSYNTGTGVATWDTATAVTLANSNQYYLWATAPSTGGSGLDAAGVRAAVGLASANLDTQLGAIDDAVDTEVGAIKTKTDFLPSATAGATGGVFIAGTNAATTVTTSLTTTFTGNLTGSVGSVTGAVGSVTGAVGSVTGNVGGNVTGSIGSVASGGITATSIATDAIGAAEIAADAIASSELATTAADEITDNVWNEAQAGHVTAGTFGAYLDSSVSGVSTGGVSADDIANAVWDKATSGHTTSGTFGEQVKTDIDAILVDTGTTLDAAVADLPTNAELATALGTADDAVLTAVGDVPTNAELATALGTADDAVLAAIAALNNLSAAQLRDTVIEDQGSTISLGCALAAILAYAGGDVATTGSSSTYEDPSGTETRIAGTAASAGNRTATITCPSY